MSIPLSAELLKQRRQGAAMAWGFLAVPAFATLFAFGLELVVPAAGGAHVVASVHPLRSAIRAVAIAGDPFAQLFYAVGAAAFFAVDYRYGTWRQIVPRNRRFALLFAKMLGFALCAAASLVLLGAGDLLASLVLPLTRGFALTDVPPATLASLTLAFGTSFLELLALGGTVALLATLTRSTLGALLPAFLLSFLLAGAEALLNLSGNALAALPLPTLAADAVRSWIGGGDGAASVGAAAIAAAALVGWSVLTYGAAALVFARQDLTTE
ncbi:MAG TPA: hypothetical protein VH331_16625 [Allosphingosinicella sp.]|nr:hypothetical protein [Allosphingosinicella sp.]